MDSLQISWAESRDPSLRTLLANHPQVGAVSEGTSLLKFKQGNSVRELFQGNDHPVLRGLVEYIDNNPMVCTDSFSLPSPLAILTLIALGPIIDAGLLVETPTVLTNLNEDSESLNPLLAEIGWNDGVLVQSEPQDLQGAGAATVIAEITTPQDPDEIDELYEERFGRSFYIRRQELGTWDVASVLGTPEAHFRLRLAEDQPRSLLTIQVMADQTGKLGNKGIIHALNVMAGFEESLGL